MENILFCTRNVMPSTSTHSGSFRPSGKHYNEQLIYQLLNPDPCTLVKIVTSEIEKTRNNLLNVHYASKRPRSMCWTVVRHLHTNCYQSNSIGSFTVFAAFHCLTLIFRDQLSFHTLEADMEIDFTVRNRPNKLTHFPYLYIRHNK